MSFIEGFGDEVTVVAVLSVLLILIWTITFANRTFFNNLLSTPELQIETDQQNSEDILQEEEQNSENHLVNCGSEAEASVDTSSVENASGDEINSLTSQLPSQEKIVTDTLPTESRDSSLPDLEQNPDVMRPDTTSGINQNTRTQPGQIRVRLKYLDDTDRTVISHLTEKIGDFKRNNFPEDVANNKIVRLIFNGQLLNDNCTLAYYSIQDSCVVHVHISQPRVPQDATTTNANADLDISNLLWPLLSVILGIFWVLYFKFPEFFSIMSVGILILFTGSFIFFYSMVQQQR